MPVTYTRYKTSDGKEFEREADAKAWQRELDGDKGAWQRHLDDKARNPAREANNSLQQEAYNKIVSYYNAGNWDAVVETYNYTAKNYSGYINFSQAYPDAYKMSQDAEKKAWEKANGRSLTETDRVQIIKNEEIKRIESSFVSKVARMNEGHDKIGGFPITQLLRESVEEWEKITGREITKEDEIRIAGKTFLKRNLFGKRK